MTKEQMEKIQEHLTLFNSLRYIGLDLHKTVPIKFDDDNTPDIRNTITIDDIKAKKEEHQEMRFNCV